VTVALGVMQLPVTEDADRVRDYLNGTIAGGGLWTALTRSSNHDHTGGNNGTPLSIAAIPDGSITVAKLDPSVLLPYALVDGSKPFTGQVTMQADAIVRDALFFGEQGTALPPDASITRTGAKTLRVDTNLGVGVAPAAWHTARRALQVGAAGSLAANPTVSFTELADNSYLDAAAAQRALVTEAAARLVLQQGSMFVWTAPSVAAGAAQTFTQRLALAQNGTLTLTPDAGADALALPGNAVISTAGQMQFDARNGGHIYVNPTSGYFMGLSDNTKYLGHPSVRWATLYTVAAPVVGSSLDLKENITPLDPAACVASVLETDWVNYVYKAPTPPERGEGVEDKDWDAQMQAYQEMLVAGASGRRQKGYVLGSPDHAVGAEFGLPDRTNRSDGADLAVVACAVQDVLRRLAVLEGNG
jgi:hypothetical protein